MKVYPLVFIVKKHPTQPNRVKVADNMGRRMLFGYDYAYDNIGQVAKANLEKMGFSIEAQAVTEDGFILMGSTPEMQSYDM